MCVIGLAGCAAQAKFTTETLDRRAPVTGEHRILLIPIDVEWIVLQASGLLEPKVDWTAQARIDMGDAFGVATQREWSRIGHGRAQPSLISWCAFRASTFAGAQMKETS